MSRSETIKAIKQALQKRSGKQWSVTGGKGTAYGWLSIDAPPKRRTWRDIQTHTPESPAPGAVYRGAPGFTPHHRVGAGVEDPITSPESDPWAREAQEKGHSLVYDWEIEDTTQEFGHMSPADRVELGKLLGLDRAVHFQGHSVPAGYDFYQEYIDRANGREPSVYGERHWD